MGILIFKKMGVPYFKKRRISTDFNERKNMKTNLHIFKNKEINLFIQFYTDKIVRFYYGEKIKKSISDAVILEAKNIETSIIKNKIISKNFDIEVSKDLLIKITDKMGNIISEDQNLIFNKSENEKNRVTGLNNINENLLEGTNKKLYGIEHQKKSLWETGFYGMGEKYGFVNLINRYTENWNTDVLGYTPTHQSIQKSYHTSIPFYIGMDEKIAYGIFYDNSFKTYFDFKKNSEFITFKSDGGNLDYYFIFGEKISDVVENYSKLTGTLKLPRKDFLGYQQCRWSYNDVKEVLEIANNMRKNEIPCDVIYLDIDYMENYKVFTFDTIRFKEFKKMAMELHKKGFKLVVIIDPGIKVEKDYKIYEEGLKNNYFIKDENGEVYIGKVWPGDSVFPDFLNEKVKKWWANLHEELVVLGVDGIWNDMNEASDFSSQSKTLPENSYHIDNEGNKRFQKEIHNLYGHYESIATYEGMKKSQRIRPFVLTRAASAGTQRYSALWTGDNSSIWEHMEISIPMLLNLGLSGYSYVGSDIGGFLDDCDKELFIRWIQLGIFYPLCRNHSTINSLPQEPWAFGYDTMNIAKKYINLRYSLINYIYNLFRESSLKGTPIMKPLFYNYQKDKNTHNINDQFLFGEDFLVAPILRPGITTRLIYLPEGNWINYFTREVFSGEKHIIFNAELSELPLFIKEGAILILNEKMNYIGEKNEKKEIHIYIGKDNEKDFYFDDGVTFDYESSIYSLLNVCVIENKITIRKIFDNYNFGNLDLVLHKNNSTEKIINIQFDSNGVYSCRTS